jgi:hypothetical protein
MALVRRIFVEMSDRVPNFQKGRHTSSPLHQRAFASGPSARSSSGSGACTMDVLTVGDICCDPLHRAAAIGPFAHQKFYVLGRS